MNAIPAQLEQALGFNLDRVATLFRRNLIQALQTYDLTPEQWQVMAALWWCPAPLTQVAIGGVTLKDKPSVSRIVARLEAKGWVKRVPNAADARSHFIALTARGKRLEKAVPRALGEHFAPILGALSQTEHTTLLRLLKKLRTALNDPATETRYESDPAAPPADGH